MKTAFRIATAQYQPQAFSEWENYAIHYRTLVQQAKDLDAAIVLMPEYSALELTYLFKGQSSLAAQLPALQELLPKYLAHFRQLAAEFNLYILPGTFPVYDKNNLFYNRAYFFGPDKEGFQDKLQLTQFERASNLIQAGQQQRIFATALGKVGIAICYDSEFPVLVSQLANAGAELILVPSCTDTLAGYHRVSLSCRARALENQCYVAQSCLVGQTDWSEIIDVNVGRAEIFSPIDGDFPSDGIIAQGQLNTTELVIGEVQLSKLKEVREKGAVRNFYDSQCYKPCDIIQLVYLS